MDYAALRALLDSDPATDTMNDTEAADWCNEVAISNIGVLPIRDIASRWLNNGTWDAILSAANDTNHAAHDFAKSVVMIVDQSRKLGLDNFDFSLSKPNQLLIGLRDAGFIDQAEVDDILEMATRRMSRAEDAGISEHVYQRDVAEARARAA